VLDDFDRMDPDSRIARSFAQLLDYRHGEKLPTIITASKWVEPKEADVEAFPILKLGDASLAHRLGQARRVRLWPTILHFMGEEDKMLAPSP
jgi:hypothetical protein